MFQRIHRHERVQALPGHVPQTMKALVGRLKDAILHQAEFFHLITTHFFDGRGPSRSEGARSIRQNRSLWAFIAHAYFPFGSSAYERLCPTFASLSGKSGNFHRLTHLCHSPTLKNRKPWHTPGNVK